ncbi:rutC family protein UK114 [Culicoides brevitarsis]|uniref:rutC family protein UK114 n=1 Tax=Culicoides brevitarsis TaxID=469753 RepID=UPI00307C6816
MSTLIRKIISSAAGPKPVAAYNQAVVVDRTVYCSGCLGMDENMKLVDGGAAAQTKKALENLKNILEAADSGLDRVVKATILLSNMDDYKAVNEEYAKVFTEGYPARTCYAVSKLPLGAAVEIEAISITGSVKTETDKPKL